MAEVIDFSTALPAVYPALNAASAGELVFWTAAELYQWLDEAAQRLARTSLTFARYDYLTIVSFPGQGAYSLPSDQIVTLQVDLAGAVLQPSSVREIEALDDQWTSTTGEPIRFLQDVAGLNSITIYPAPNSLHSFLPVGLVMHVTPATVDAGSPTLAAPTCLTEFFTLSAIAEARAKETKAAMPEVATWCRSLVDLYEQVITGYWGPGQP